MMIGIGLGLTMARVGSFTPAALPGISAWYDPSDLSTLFQDDAMTVPVTTDGQTVAAIRDKSGNGRHITQATAAARPIYRTDGAHHWLKADGIDDILSGSFTGAVYPMTLAVAHNVTSAGAALAVYSSNEVFTNIRFPDAATAQAKAMNGIGVYATTQMAVSGDAVSVAEFTSSALSLRVNGGSKVTTAHTVPSFLAANIRLFGIGSYDRLAGRVFAAAVYNRQLTEAETTVLTRWMADRAGVTF